MTTAGSDRSAVRWGRWRLTTQLVVVALYVALPFAVVAGGVGANGSLAAFGVGPLELVEPIGAASAVLGGRELGLRLLVGVAPVLLLALLLGPVFCSWVCPFGLLSELLDRLRRRGRPLAAAPVPSAAPRRRLRMGLLVGVLAGSLALAVPLVALVSPPRLATLVPLELARLGRLGAVTASLVALLVVFELLGPRRLWCRGLCPVGAGHNLLRLPWSLTVESRPARCLCPRVALCRVACPWGLDPRTMARHDGCTNCFACIDSCPSGSLAPAFGRSRPTAVLEKRSISPPRGSGG